MKISVVTVCLNSEKTIPYTIESFLKQTYPKKEMIVVDGCSTDRTLDIVRSFRDDSIRIISQRDRGIYDAMNSGLKAYSGDAVGFLNSDDTFHDAAALERISSALAKADAVYGDLIFVSDHISKQPLRTWRAGLYRRGNFRLGWDPPHPTFYIQRSLANAVGSFDLQYGLSADYDFMLRALEVHSPKVCYVPHTLVDFMLGGSTTNNPVRYITGNFLCLRSRRQHLKSPAVDLALLLKPLRKVRQFHWRA
jgi:glycosyltransferase involved in cell wall biosynthesis